MKALLKGFKYAAKGFFYCLRNERNMRIHVVMALYVLVFSRFWALSAAEYAILVIVIALVIGAEMINTAIETLVNLAARGYDQLAKIAKDVAAGFVLVFSICAVAVGILLFGRADGFTTMAVYFSHEPLRLIPYVIVFILSLFFIFCGPNKMRNTVSQKMKGRR